MTSHTAPAAEMLMPPAPQPVARAAASVPTAPTTSAAPEAAEAPTTPAAPTAPSIPATLSRGTAVLDWFAPVRTWQTVAWEAATLAAAAGHGRSALTEAVAYTGAGALIGMSSLRVHGRCLAQWTDTQGRYRYRRLSAKRRAEAEAEAAAAPLATLLPDLGLGGYVDRAGNRVGLAASDGGWVATVRLGPAVEPDVGALLAVLREAFADTTIPLAGAQLVVWTADGSAARSASMAEPADGDGDDEDGPETPDPTQDPADLTATVPHNVLPPGGFPPLDLDTTMTLPVLRPGAANQASSPPPPPPSSASTSAAADLDLTVTLPALTPQALAAIGSSAHPAPNQPPAPAVPVPVPVNRGPMRVYWLTLRYRPRQAPHAAMARGGGELGAARAVASAALGLVSRLDSAGYSADALDQMEFGQELLVALNAGDPAPSEVRETWRDWSTGRLRQVCFEPHRSLDPAGLLVQWAPGAAFTCSSYTLSRTPRGRIRGASAMRIAGPDVDKLVPPVPAVRANGRHQEFVLRTLPLAFT
ncbi:type VII secretion protein EccE [Catenulispora yoronensis]